jgi:uncharacterized protein YjbJ (UPF0337 family)
MSSRFANPAVGLSAYGAEHSARRRGPKKTNRTFVKGRSMNWDRIEGNWKQLKGDIKQKWGKLTDDEFDVIAGKRDKLVGKIQERYGCSRDEADAQVKTFEDEYSRH